jgi:hypothetical protein
MIHPGNDVAVNDGHIYNYFCEDYSMIIPSFEERSTKMLGVSNNKYRVHLFFMNEVSLIAMKKRVNIFFILF